MANTVIHTHTQELAAFHMGEGQGEAKHNIVYVHRLDSMLHQ